MPFLTVQIESNKGNQNLYEMFKEAGEVVDENERDLEVKISFNSFLEKFATAYGSLDRMGKLFVRHLKSEDDWEDQDHNDFKAAIREESLRPYCVYITTSNYGTEYDRSLIFYGSKEITDLLNTLPIKYKSKGTKSEKQAIERGGIAIKRNYDGVTMGGKTALEREVKRELRNRKERIFFIDKTDETYYSLGYRHKHSKKRFDKIGNL